MPPQFENACMTNNLSLLKTLKLSNYDRQRINHMFTCVCEKGYLEIAEYLFDNGADISCNDNEPFLYACAKGHLHIAQWLHKLGVDISHTDNLEVACESGNIYLVKWLIEIYFKNLSFIHFSFYPIYKLEIKELLIEANLVHPRKLNERDLEHYLARTNGLVPADFDYPNTQGQRTKSALV